MPNTDPPLDDAAVVFTDDQIKQYWDELAFKPASGKPGGDDALAQLKASGNSLFVVEHALDVIRSCAALMLGGGYPHPHRADEARLSIRPLALH